MLKNILNKKSDYCLIFSDLFNLFIQGHQKKTIIIIDQLIKFLIKNNKTIILPTFNLNFPKTKITGFEDKYIQTGFLNKYVCMKYKFYRTKKPMYNYAVLGPKKNDILNLKQNTAWGKDSVLGHLVENNCTGIGLNIEKKFFNWLVIHYCEEKNKVPYRFYKTFKGRNINLKKNVYEKMYVRNLKKNFIEDGLKINKQLLKKKTIKSFKIKHLSISLINLYDYSTEADKFLKKDIYSLVKNEK
tara:strand:+ start:1329 stop:2057 length:729 start_codon:yes stop_codon:yes gene_type:complete